jgi:hypothetical protein
MVEKSRTRLLEVSVTHHPPRWEWEVSSNGGRLANGFEAIFEGYDALFLLLAAGWDP